MPLQPLWCSSKGSTGVFRHVCCPCCRLVLPVPAGPTSSLCSCQPCPLLNRPARFGGSDSKFHRQQASRARVPDTAAAVRRSAKINSVPGVRDWAPLLGCARVHKKVSHPSYWHARDKAGQAPAQHGMSQDSIEQYSMPQWTQMDQQHNNHTL